MDVLNKRERVPIGKQPLVVLSKYGDSLQIKPTCLKDSFNIHMIRVVLSPMTEITHNQGKILTTSQDPIAFHCHSSQLLEEGLVVWNIA